LSEGLIFSRDFVAKITDHIKGIQSWKSMDRGELAKGNLYVEITPDSLDVTKYTKLVSDPGAGAIASFIGVTRDTFVGKQVERLEYEAYVPMALKKLIQLCEEGYRKWDLKKVAIAHRTGVVGVGESSVVIVASSAHRKEALEAVHWAIDELKATVPIWKKEFFTGGEVWKENAESRARLLQKEIGGR
jgi:molybdopterin synthase catalytic subunit